MQVSGDSDDAGGHHEREICRVQGFQIVGSSSFEPESHSRASVNTGIAVSTPNWVESRPSRSRIEMLVTPSIIQFPRGRRGWQTYGVRMSLASAGGSLGRTARTRPSPRLWAAIVARDRVAIVVDAHMKFPGLALTQIKGTPRCGRDHVRRFALDTQGGPEHQA